MENVIYINGRQYNHQNYVDEKAAAPFLGVSIKTLQAWRAQCKGPRYRKVGGRLVRYRIGDLIDFAEALIVEPVA